ncbi:hypothetical protein IKG29_01645 [Candidatus Saccharibacteria bacterium]|nr:hypothetical protein [Candidatus Saccharibacteria bacterium]
MYGDDDDLDNLDELDDGGRAGSPDSDESSYVKDRLNEKLKEKLDDKKKAKSSAGKKAADRVADGEKAANAVGEGAANAAGAAVSEGAASTAGAAVSEGAASTAGAAAGEGAASAAGGWIGIAVAAAVAVFNKIRNERDGYKKAFMILLLFAFLVGVPVLITNLPELMIGAIDFNLQRSLGFSNTSAILEKQAEYVTEEMLASGEVPEKYAEDLSKYGMEVGQVTLAGDFVRTNSYIADIDSVKEVAAIGGHYSYVSMEEGELAIRFKDKIIKASEFVAEVESDPEMYDAYSDALDIDTRFYYSDEVDSVYKEMGASRNPFGDWTSTGDSEQDMENFSEALAEVLDSNSSVTINGYSDEGGGEGEDGEDDESGNSFSIDVSGREADEVIEEVADNMRGQDATAKAAQLLNAAISSDEPYKATKAFVTVEAVIQEARIDGTGPVNEMMNLMSRPTSVTYVDANTNESITEKKSILETSNFAAAVSDGSYSVSEAVNFSRDRVLDVTGITDSNVVRETTVASKNDSRFNIGIKTYSGDSADTDTLLKTDSSLTIAFSKNNSELFPSVVGGNRIPEGGSFLSNNINSRVLGAMPSDREAIVRYDREVNEVIARRMKADQATKSPFDVSSPYTFLGSLMHNFAGVLIRNYSSSFNGFSVIPSVNVMSELTIDSTKSLFDRVVAEGSGDNNNNNFTTLSGDCETVKAAANVEGDIYCTAHNTISTGYMSKTKEDWEELFEDSFDESGNIEKKSDLGNFIALGMGRETTVGVKSADICERWKEINDSGLKKFLNRLTDPFGLRDSCYDVDKDDKIISTGAYYTLSDSNSNKENVGLYSGYVLHETVYSLLSEKQSAVAAFKDGYYTEYPRDNSPAARIARISGMEKSEAEIALEYLSYLNVIANYNPATRFVFGKLTIENQKPILYHDEAIKEEIYCMWCGRKEFADLRNRNFVV